MKTRSMAYVGPALLHAAAIFALSGCALNTSGSSYVLDESHDPEIPDGEDLEIDTAQDFDVPESEDEAEIEPDIPPSCGDGLVDEGEECDDGNAVDGDGCDRDCTYSCRSGEECRDAEPCNGEETCDEDLHRCAAGDPRADGFVCTPDPRSICLDGTCRVSECGDGFVDVGGGETCEPADDPVCREDCTYECTGDADCPDDGEPCNGEEFCNMTEGVCGRRSAPADGTECGASSVPREICIGGTCQESVCGDSFVDAGADPAEECDDGNAVDTDDCTSACRSAVCGDGYVHSGVEECDGHDPLTCTTSCGSTGTQSCLDCNWADCAPPEEACNALDDDCDGEVDETFPCVAGSTVACTNMCGGSGTGPCTASCELPAPSGCSAPPEICNGEDDDCDGRVDEDFVLESDPLNCGACGAVCPEACVRGSCTIARCDDGVMNGDETDVDCGGLECRGCIGGLSCTYGSDCESGLCQTGLCVTGCNVIVNGSAELGGSGTAIPGWTVLQNGGDGWRVETGYAPPPTERANHNFVTSFNWDRKGQLVDLRTAGFSTAQLGLRPDIYVCDWVRRRWDGVDSQTDYYYLRAELRNSGGTAFSTWTRGSTGSPIGTTSDAWVLEGNTFSGYTSSLAFVYLEHGGHDGEYWAGWYGTKFDGARITVLGIPCPSCADGVQNQEETGIDCGGICAACP